MNVKVRKNGIFLIMSIFTIVSLLFFLPIQPIRAMGPNLIEGIDGYNVNETDNLTYKCITSLDPSIFNVSDRIRYNITQTNNSQTGFGWTADTVWSTIEYYNSYNDTWKDINGSSTFCEYLIAAYNSTTTYVGTYGSYNCFIDGIDILLSVGFVPVKIPNNFTAANHSIVTELTGFLINNAGYTNILHSSPSIISGTWKIWSNDGSDDTLFSITYNKNGTCTRYCWQVELFFNWEIYYDFRLETTGGGDGFTEILPLLFLMMGSGDGIVTEVIIGIVAAIAVIVVIIIIIVINRVKK